MRGGGREGGGARRWGRKRPTAEGGERVEVRGRSEDGGNRGSAWEREEIRVQSQFREAAGEDGSAGRETRSREGSGLKLARAQGAPTDL